MKVFIFMIKKFYVSRGIDLPMAINNDDVKVFKSLEDAEIYRSNLFEDAKGLAGNHFLKEEFCHTAGYNYIALHFTNGTRFIYEIISSDLISSLQ